MAYKIMSGAEVVCDSTSPGGSVNNPVLKMKVNRVWSLQFVLPPDHHFYDKVVEHSTEFSVSFDGGDPVFTGEVQKFSTDFHNNKTIYAEDQLGYLNQAVVPPHRYSSLNVSDIITLMVGVYNDQCPDRPFAVGTISTTHTAHNLAFSTNYDSVLSVLQENVIGKCGGYIYAYTSNGTRYIGYKESADSSGTTQAIKIGANLLDFVRETDATKLCSILVPLGARLDKELQTVDYVEQRLTIETDQRQTDRIESSSMISAIGRVVKTRIWDGITDPDDLYNTGAAYLTNQLEDITIEATAFDLNLADAKIQRIHLFDNIRVISEPHNLDTRFPVLELKLNLNNPSADKITLGKTELPSLSKQTAEASAQLVNTPTFVDAAELAAKRAAYVLEAATNGYIYFHYNENDVLDEIYIKDLTDPTLKWWRWNVNGLGYTSDGGNTYAVAMTMAGELISYLGTIGGWEITASGLSKTTADPNDPTKLYRVTLYPPNASTPSSSPILDFTYSEDSGASWQQNFYVPGDGSLTIFSPNSDGVERISIRDKTSPSVNNTILNSNGIHINHEAITGYSVEETHLFTSSLTFYAHAAQNRVLRAMLSEFGAYFYDANGDMSASYPSGGWTEYEMTDQYAASGKTKWYYLHNGQYTMAMCKREFSNVVVNYQWGNIYCGTGTNGSGINFPAIAYPWHYDSAPMCLVTLSMPKNTSGEAKDGWLVSNARNSAADPTWYSPAYDLARGSSGTIATVYLNYFVLGKRASS